MYIRDYGNVVIIGSRDIAVKVRSHGPSAWRWYYQPLIDLINRGERATWLARYPYSSAAAIIGLIEHERSPNYAPQPIECRDADPFGVKRLRRVVRAYLRRKDGASKP